MEVLSVNIATPSITFIFPLFIPIAPSLAETPTPFLDTTISPSLITLTPGPFPKIATDSLFTTIFPLFIPVPDSLIPIPTPLSPFNTI